MVHLIYYKISSEIIHNALSPSAFIHLSSSFEVLHLAVKLQGLQLFQSVSWVSTTRLSVSTHF
jgi:hypothetical protein